MIKRKLLAADESSKKQPRRDEPSSDEEESAQHTTSQGRMLVLCRMSDWKSAWIRQSHRFWCLKRLVLFGLAYVMACEDASVIKSMSTIVCILCVDSSQSDSMSDADEPRPSFSRHSQSQQSDSQDPAGKFSMYNSVSQKLMVKQSLLFHPHTEMS